MLDVTTNIHEQNSTYVSVNHLPVSTMLQDNSTAIVVTTTEKAAGSGSQIVTLTSVFVASLTICLFLGRYSEKILFIVGGSEHLNCSKQVCYFWTVVVVF